MGAGSCSAGVALCPRVETGPPRWLSAERLFGLMPRALFIFVTMCAEDGSIGSRPSTQGSVDVVIGGNGFGACDQGRLYGIE